MTDHENPTQQTNSQNRDKMPLMEEQYVLSKNKPQGIDEQAGNIEDINLKVSPANKKNRKFLSLTFRILIWTPICFITILLLSILGFNAFLSSHQVRNLLTQKIEEQTGGKIEISDLEFNLLHGIRIKGLRLYPPIVTDERGFRFGGTVTDNALLEIDGIDFDYNLRGLFAGRLNIDALQIIRPRIHLEEHDGVYNFQGILNYRSKKFPRNQESEEKVTSDDRNRQASHVPDFLIDPAYLLMPVDILLQKIGIADFEIAVFRYENQILKQKIGAEGLTLEVGIHWYKNKSSLLLCVQSPTDKSFHAFVDRLPDEHSSKEPANLTKIMSLSTDFIIKSEISDFAKVNFDYLARVNSLESKDHAIAEILSEIRLRLSAKDAYKTIYFEELSINIADFLKHHLSGQLKISDYTAENIDVDIKQNLSVNLDQAARLVKAFVKKIDFGGFIAISNLDIRGQVQPKKLAAALPNIDQNLDLPSLIATINIEEFWAKYPDLGVDLGPLSSHSHINTSRDVDRGGLQLDLNHKLSLANAAISTAPNRIGPIKASVENLNINLLTRAIYPSLVAPIFKLDVEAAHIRAQGNNISAVDLPLAIKINADGSADLAKISGDLDVALGNILKLVSRVDCNERCQKIRASVDARIDSLSKIFNIFLPLNKVLGLNDAFPDKLSGAVGLNFETSGTIPDPFKTSVADLIRLADIHWRWTSSIDRMDVKIPKFSANLSDFNTRLHGEGSVSEQRLELSQRFNRLDLNLEMLKDPDGKSQVVAIDRYAFDANIDNKIAGALDLSRLEHLLHQLTTSISLRFDIARVSGLNGILPRPINNFRFSTDMAQKSLTDLQLKSLRLGIPDFGFNFDMDADVRLNSELLPERFRFAFTNDIALTGLEPIPLGIKADGRMELKLAADASDVLINIRDLSSLEKSIEKLEIRMDGGAKFEQFNLRVPDLKVSSNPDLLNVEMLSGELPFRQTINIPDILKKIAEIRTKRDNSKSSTANLKSQTNLADSPDNNDRVAIESALEEFTSQNNRNEIKSGNTTAMVDYSNVRPFYPGRRPLSIKKVEAANLAISDIEIDLELKQNWLLINQYMMTFLGGKIRGDLQMAFDPIPKFFQTNLQMTKLDTRKLLDKFPNIKAKTQSSFSLSKSDPEIDGTFRFSYDVGSTDMNGGLEITKIGKEQVEMMLYFIDPYEQNPSISDLRKALALGEPAGVSIPIKSSRVGFEVEVRSPLTLGQPIPGLPRFRDIPINQIVDGAIAKVMDDVRAVKDSDTDADEYYDDPGVESEKRGSSQTSQDSSELRSGQESER